jgi:peptidoglycan/LPS O-acetylase OafA/YrhL
MIVLSFLKLDLSRSRLQKFIVPLGDASYALYLTHPFVMITYARLLKGSLADLPQWPVVPVVVALSAGLGLANYILVERKLMAITRHLFSRQLSSPRNQGVPAPATTP